ncbi:hypothetical protein J3Q64DRAFT_1747747 [Phycomyces blakesleeanus]|uniref:F-box domain-containing protein n=1 Tax=Phycomyces blakesleeanus TaxID=4837 RepID=A0ABR3B0Q8_PHYBL
MLAADLPFEILVQLSGLLLAEDKCACALTCKRWKTPFQESLWKSIEVKSMENLIKLCTIAKRQASEFPYSVVTQSACIAGSCTLSDLFQNDFPGTFMNSKHLYMKSISFEDIDTHIPINNNPWKSLVRLRLCIQPMRYEISMPALISFLTVVPNLQEIEIFPVSPKSFLYFNSNDFNTLHKKLPQLTSIKAGLILKDIHEDDAYIIPNTTQAITVKSLDVSLKE